MNINYEPESGAEITLSAPSLVSAIDQLLDVDDAGWYLNWLAWLCSQLPNATAALVVSGDQSGTFQSQAIWPESERSHDQLLLDAATATLDK